MATETNVVGKSGEVIGTMFANISRSGSAEKAKFRQFREFRPLAPTPAALLAALLDAPDALASKIVESFAKGAPLVYNKGVWRDKKEPSEKDILAFILNDDDCGELWMEKDASGGHPSREDARKLAVERLHASAPEGVLEVDKADAEVTASSRRKWYKGLVDDAPDAV